MLIKAGASIEEKDIVSERISRFTYIYIYICVCGCVGGGGGGERGRGFLPQYCLINEKNHFIVLQYFITVCRICYVIIMNNITILIIVFLFLMIITSVLLLYFVNLKVSIVKISSQFFS